MPFPQLLSIVMLIAIYAIGEFLGFYFRLPIPGSAIGLVFCTLAMVGIPALRPPLRPGALVLLALVPLFLVPVLVRMAVAIDFTALTTWLAIGILCAASLLGALLAGVTAKFILKRDGEA
ncbi:MAG TPA: CidA/LrgA family protein [Burkholderiales bacterium]|nr:CidA/LrgA family protein [Burkholderiales bacterium]